MDYTYTGLRSYNPNRGNLSSVSYAPAPAPVPTAPVVIGIEPQAYEGVLYGKPMPVFIGGKLLIGGRIIEGPFYQPGVDGDQLCSYSAYHAICADPAEARTVYEYRLRGQQVWTSGGGYLDTAKLPSGGLDTRTGTASQAALTQSVERDGAGAIAYRNGIISSIRNASLRAFGGIIPFPSLGIQDNAYADGIPRQVAIEKCLRYMRLDDADFEVDVSGEDSAWIMASTMTLQDFLSRLRGIFVQYQITYTDKVRIIEPSDFSISFNLNGRNLVRGQTRFEKTDPLLIPRQLQYSFINGERDNEPDVAMAQEDVYPQPATSSVDSSTVELPIVTNAAQAASDVHLALYEGIATRNKMNFIGLPSLFGMEPGDGCRFVGDSTVNSFIDKAVRAEEVQHDYETWQVEVRAAEVLNCGLAFCAAYPLTEPEVLSLTYHPADFDPLSYIAGGVLLGGYIYAVTNWAVIVRVPVDAFNSPEYLDISSSAISGGDWIYAHAPFVYNDSVYLTAINTVSNLSEVLRIDGFSGVTKIGDFGSYNLGSSTLQSRVVIDDTVYIALQYGGDILKCNLETGEDDIYFLTDHPSGLFQDITGMCGDGRYLYMMVLGSGGSNYLVRLDTNSFDDDGLSYMGIGSHTGGIPCLVDGTIKAVLNDEGGALLSADTGLNSYTVSSLSSDVFETIDWWYGSWWDGCRYLYALPEYPFHLASTPDYYLLRIDLQSSNAIETVSLNSPEGYYPFQIGTDIVFDGEAGEAGSYLYAMSSGHFDDPPHDVTDPDSNPYIVIARMPTVAP
jgi:hypothetical protein